MKLLIAIGALIAAVNAGCNSNCCGGGNWCNAGAAPKPYNMQNECYACGPASNPGSVNACTGCAQTGDDRKFDEEGEERRLVKETLRRRAQMFGDECGNNPECMGCQCDPKFVCAGAPGFMTCGLNPNIDEDEGGNDVDCNEVDCEEEERCEEGDDCEDDEEGDNRRRVQGHLQSCGDGPGEGICGMANIAIRDGLEEPCDNTECPRNKPNCCFEDLVCINGQCNFQDAGGEEDRDCVEDCENDEEGDNRRRAQGEGDECGPPRNFVCDDTEGLICCNGFCCNPNEPKEEDERRP